MLVRPLAAVMFRLTSLLPPKVIAPWRLFAHAEALS
jgi:hypothetical protein